MNKQGMRLERQGGWRQIWGALNATFRSMAVTGSDGLTLGGRMGLGEITVPWQLG